MVDVLWCNNLAIGSEVISISHHYVSELVRLVCVYFSIARILGLKQFYSVNEGLKFPYGTMLSDDFLWNVQHIDLMFKWLLLLFWL